MPEIFLRVAFAEAMTLSGSGAFGSMAASAFCAAYVAARSSTWLLSALASPYAARRFVYPADSEAQVAAVTGSLSAAYGRKPGVLKIFHRVRA